MFMIDALVSTTIARLPVFCSDNPQPTNAAIIASEKKRGTNFFISFSFNGYFVAAQGREPAGAVISLLAISGQVPLARPGVTNNLDSQP